MQEHAFQWTHCVMLVRLATNMCVGVASTLFALVMLAGCESDRPEDPVPEDWFAYFRLTQNDEAHLYIRDEWEYALVPDRTASEEDMLLAAEHRQVIEDLFSNGLDTYESDSMSTSGVDMGECDATDAHPIVHKILINPSPLVGRPGFGCWSIEEDLSQATQTMLERMEGLLRTLRHEDAGSL